MSERIGDTFCSKLLICLLLCLVAPIVHLCFVFLVWDDGVSRLLSVVNNEFVALGMMTGRQTDELLSVALQKTAVFLFINSGIQGIAYSPDPTFFQGVLINN